MNSLIFSLDLLMVLYFLVGFMLVNLIYYIYKNLTKALPIRENAQKFLNQLDKINNFRYEERSSIITYNIITDDLNFYYYKICNRLVIYYLKSRKPLVDEIDHANENLIKLNKNEKLLITSKIKNIYSNHINKENIKEKNEIENIMKKI